MANQPNQFKHRDIVRAFKAAEAAGVPNPSVQVHCPNGTVITIDSKPEAAAAVIPKPGKVRQPASRPVR
jgi:propanediol dehydratase large subunit